MAKKMGRPTKLTAAVQRDYLTALRRTWYIDTAADLAGVGRVTVYGWLKRGNREKTGIHRDFLNAVKKALAEKESQQAAVIEQAAAENWTAAAWLLERRNPKRWGRKDKATVEHTGPKGGPVQVREVIVATRQEARELLGHADVVPGANGVHRLNGTH